MFQKYQYFQEFLVSVFYNSIIGQGKIDEILSNKSEDRRRIFEEAAGIVKYRTRKVESERKLELYVYFLQNLNFEFFLFLQLMIQPKFSNFLFQVE